jgi:hypothetical protein
LQTTPADTAAFSSVSHSIRALEDKKSVSPGNSIESRDDPNFKILDLTESNPAGEESAERGVIGLLQEGHFKGVADIRLRINFMDELDALNQKEVKQVAAENITDIRGLIENKVGELLKSDAITSEQADAISELEKKLVEEIQNTDEQFRNDEVSLDIFVGNIGNALDNFIGSLSPILITQPGNQTPAEETVPQESLAINVTESAQPADYSTIQEPTSDTVEEIQLQEFLDELQSGFAGVLEEFTTKLSGVSVLPNLSPPSGNGVAYDKFVAIYDELTSPPPSTESLFDAEV